MGQRCKVGPSVKKKINFIHHHKGQNHKGQNHFNRYRILFDKIQNPLMIKLKQASQEKNFLNKRSKKKPRVYLIITTTTYTHQGRSLFSSSLSSKRDSCGSATNSVIDLGVVSGIFWSSPWNLHSYLLDFSPSESQRVMRGHVEGTP